LIAESCGALSPTDPGTYWYEDITHAGAESSFMDSTYKANYEVFRNVVTDFGADNTGSTDASVAIQNAINGKLLHEPLLGF
jgi:glucan 1,3-beta-glucosidase